MRIGLDIAQQRMPFAEVTARAIYAEEAGFDGVWGFDHFQPMYGEGPGECFEGHTTLAALSGHTSRVRLGLLVAGVTYRHPSVVAAEAMTIDHASNGRLDLSLGAAWFEPEHTALGIPFPSTATRIGMLDEALTIIKGLLTTDGFSFEGEHWQLRDATLHPRPVQSPTPPIWIGASGERKMLPLVARHADVWHTFGDPATLRRKSALLDQLATDAGRDPASIERAASLSLSEPWDQVRATAEDLRAAGFGQLICGWPSEGRERIDEFAAEILPALQAGLSGERMATFSIERSDGPFGAVVHGVDLAGDISNDLAAELRRVWLDHQVLVFPHQDLSFAQLEAAALAFGPIGEDPYFRPIPGQPHVVALTREADETTPLFADVWHSDWSFLPSPPAGTMLYGVDIPPVGGDTLYADQYGAYDAMPPSLQARVEGLMGVHSARRGYSKAGLYGDRDQGRSMAIVASDTALETHLHPLVRHHPETGRPALYVSLAYTIGIDGLDDDEANALIGELLGYVARDELVHRHRWEPGMVVLWDNRCLLHAATGGYEGHRRELHRLTIAVRP